MRIENDVDAIVTITSMRMNDGTLPAYAWPGGYQLAYLLADNAIICPDCANGKNGSDAHELAEERQWQIVAAFIHWEGDAIICDHCNAEIPSAYDNGDDDE